jgi:uncharacterized protein YjbJ (UPF0337 family)
MDENRVEGTVREFAGKAQGAAGDMLGDSKTSAQGRVNEAAGQATDQLRGLADELTDRIHETPLLAVLGAVGLGYLIGKITSR